MNSRIWEYIGRSIFWISWPALFVGNYISKRTRVLVVCGNEILLVKGWISDGTWSLPGGGLHRNEDPAAGAARELIEETGIEVNDTKLQKLYSGMTYSEKGLKYYVYAFLVVLENKPSTNLQKFELINLEWMNWKQAYGHPGAGKNIRKIIDAWQAS